MADFLETKIEYDLTPEMAEKLAVEQAILRVPRLRRMHWTIPIFFGIIFASIVFGRSNSTNANEGVTVNVEFSWFKIAGAVIGFGFGFGTACLYQSIWRSQILQKLRWQAQKSSEKFGTSRKFSWDTETLTLSSSLSETKIKWRALDNLLNAKLGIHGFAGEQIIFSLPKSILPSNLSADDLITTWESYSGKPPKLK